MGQIFNCGPLPISDRQKPSRSLFPVFCSVHSFCHDETSNNNGNGSLHLMVVPPQPPIQCNIAPIKVPHPFLALLPAAPTHWLLNQRLCSKDASSQHPPRHTLSRTDGLLCLLVVASCLSGIPFLPPTAPTRQFLSQRLHSKLPPISTL